MQRIFKIEINFSTPEKSPEKQAEQANEIENALTGLDFAHAVRMELNRNPALRNIVVKVDTF